MHTVVVATAFLAYSCEAIASEALTVCAASHQAGDSLEMGARSFFGTLGLQHQRLLHHAGKSDRILLRIIVLHATILEECGNPLCIELVLAGFQQVFHCCDLDVITQLGHHGSRLAPSLPAHAFALADFSTVISIPHRNP